MIARDKDVARRAVTLSKLDKFQRLRNVPRLSDAELISRFGAINTENDEADVRLLAALEAKAIDFLVSQDIRLHRRAERAGLGASIFTVEEALQWLKQTFVAKAVSLPYVVESKAYEVSQDHPIVDSLQADYPGFDDWFDRCRRQHRDCWILKVDEDTAGLVIRKTETHAEAGTQFAGTNILKICTFKVRDEFQGEKFGELLLKQVLWFAQRNQHDLVYVTTSPKHAFLIALLSYYGFEQTDTMANGEIMLEKVILTGALPDVTDHVFDFDRQHYPRYYDGPVARKFCVPIRPDYHRRLFPEIAFGAELPLFPAEKFGPMLAIGEERIPGNTIRKVYLCRAKITLLRPGDLLFFYMSKDEQYASSQSITTLGIVEQVINATTADDLIRHTAKRSVYSPEELRDWGASASSPVKMIDFLLVGHIEPPVRLNTLVSTGVFSNRPPQSIAELTEGDTRRSRPMFGWALTRKRARSLLEKRLGL